MSNTVTCNASETAIQAKTDPDRLLPLWEAVEKLIGAWARQYAKTTQTRLYDVSDLMQAGYLALVDAVQGYDPERGEFTTHLRFHVRRRFAEVAGRRGTKQRPELYAVSLSTPLTVDPDMTLGDTLADDAAAFETSVIERVSAHQDYAAVVAEIDRLPDRLRLALMLTAYEGLSHAEAATRIGCEQSKVRTYREQARQAIRRTKIGRQMWRDTYRHVTLARWKQTHTSAVEAALLWAEELRGRYDNQT